MFGIALGETFTVPIVLVEGVTESTFTSCGQQLQGDSLGLSHAVDAHSIRGVRSTPNAAWSVVLLVPIGQAAPK